MIHNVLLASGQWYHWMSKTSSVKKLFFSLNPWCWYQTSPFSLFILTWSGSALWPRSRTSYRDFFWILLGKCSWDTQSTGHNLKSFFFFIFWISTIRTGLLIQDLCLPWWPIYLSHSPRITSAKPRLCYDSRGLSQTFLPQRAQSAGDKSSSSSWGSQGLWRLPAPGDHNTFSYVPASMLPVSWDLPNLVGPRQSKPSSGVILHLLFSGLCWCFRGLCFHSGLWLQRKGWWLCELGCSSST